MRKRVLVLMVFVLLIGCMGLTGCSQKKTAEEPAANQQVAATGQNSGSSDLADIMKSASAVKDLSFEVTSTTGEQGKGVSSTGKYYMSGKKIRIEAEAEGMKMVSIVNANGEMWMYNPADKTAMKLSAPQQDQSKLPTEWTKEDLSAMKIVGSEKKDGFDCVIVTVNENGTTSKMWLRKDIGMPVRIESATPEGPVVIEYKNYNLDKQPDSLFEIPADAQVMSMPQVPPAPGIPQQ